METSRDDVHDRPCIVDADTVAQSANYGGPAPAAALLPGIVGPQKLLEGHGQPDIDAQDA